MTGSDSHNTYTMHYKHYHVRYKGLNIGYINYSYIRFSDLELSFWFELGYLKAVNKVHYCRAGHRNLPFFLT